MQFTLRNLICHYLCILGSQFKQLVLELSQLGLSVCYHQILELEKQIPSSLCENSNETGVVCPSQLRHDLFTIGIGSMELLSYFISAAFVWIALNPFTQFDTGSPSFRLLEIFTVVLYCKKSNTDL